MLDTVRADAKKIETARKTPKKSFRADEIFRPKWSTALIATAWQKHWKMSTARILKSWKSGTCTAVWLKKVEKIGTCMPVLLKQSRLG